MANTPTLVYQAARTAAAKTVMSILFREVSQEVVDNCLVGGPAPFTTISGSEIAAVCGLGTSHVYQTLKDLEEDGLIRTDYQSAPGRSPTKGWTLRIEQRLAIDHAECGSVFPNGSCECTEPTVGDVYKSESEPPPSVVYFIQAAGGPIKIGVTTDINQRLRELQVANPLPLVTLGTIPGTQALERELHLKLTQHRIRGEWFKPDDEVLAVLLRERVRDERR